MRTISLRSAQKDGWDGNLQTFEVKDLAGKIVCDECRVDVSSVNMVIILRKVDVKGKEADGVEWAQLEAENEPEGVKKVIEEIPPVITTEQLENDMQTKTVISSKSTELMFSLD
tara:strand:+ start:219 stop:560 length:342 start_codon:yes stop_codon:yes gene_type:complete